MSDTIYDTVGTRCTLSQFGALAQTPHSVYEYNLSLIRQTLEVASIQFEPGSKVLDLACGKLQYMVNHLWGDAALRVGADLHLTWLKANQDVDVRVCSNMYYLPFSDQSFDTIVSVDTIEHAEHPESLLREMSRVLKPQGRVLIFTPNLLGYKSIIAKFGGNLFSMAHKLVYQQDLHYDVFYRSNTLSSLRKLSLHANLYLRKVYYIGEISHFFYRSQFLSTLAFSYNHVVTHLHAPWLLNYMMVVLQKS